MRDRENYLPLSSYVFFDVDPSFLSESCLRPLCQLRAGLHVRLDRLRALFRSVVFQWPAERLLSDVLEPDLSFRIQNVERRPREGERGHGTLNTALNAS